MAHPFLTDRQAEMLEQICAGQTQREIAVALGVDLSTVREHMGAVRLRLGRQHAIEDLCRLFAEGKPVLAPNRSDTL